MSARIERRIQTVEEKLKSSFLKLAIPLLLGFGALLFGLIGWTIASYDGTFRSVSDIVVRVIGTFVLSDGPASQPSNWATQFGKLLAALASASGAILLALMAAKEAIDRAAVANLWTGHVVVIGDSPMARLITEAFEAEHHRSVQIAPLDSPKSIPWGSKRIRVGYDPEVIFSASALRYARHVFIDTNSDVETLALGRRLIADLSIPGARPFQRMFHRADQRTIETISLRVTDRFLADQFSELNQHDQQTNGKKLIRSEIFNENHLIARFVLGTFPLFKIAASLNQRRVHAVFFGFTDLTERLIDQIILTSVAGSLDLPRISILHNSALECEKRFRVRRPSVCDSLDIRFFDFDIDSELDATRPLPEPLETRFSTDSSHDLTALFVTTDSSEETVRVVFQLRRYNILTGGFKAPILYETQAKEAARDILQHSSNDPLVDNLLIPMRAPTKMLLRSASSSEDTERLARALHHNFSRVSRARGEHAPPPWDDLPETLRRANLRAADHLPAKLWSLGFDPNVVDGIPRLSPDDRTTLQKLLEESDQPTFRKLAELEHNRWMVDRQLDGWTYGPERDDRRRIHPLLVPWSELKKAPEEVAKDVEQVLTAIRFIVTLQS